MEEGPARRQPERTCIGCRGKKPASELVRLVRDASGSVEPGRHLPGRGAWLCAGNDTLVNGECLDVAARRHAFQRAFRAPVDDAAIAKLRTKVGKRARMGGRGRITDHEINRED